MNVFVYEGAICTVVCVCIARAWDRFLFTFSRQQTIRTFGHNFIIFVYLLHIRNLLKYKVYTYIFDN